MSERYRGKLVEFIQEALAMEEAIGERLRTMAETARDPATRDLLERHAVQTGEQAGRLRERLRAHGHEESALREAAGAFRAAFQGIVEVVRGDPAARGAREAFAAEHLEIATYALLERVAEAAGDPETAAVARRTRVEEEAMAAALASGWDRVAQQALRE